MEKYFCKHCGEELIEKLIDTNEFSIFTGDRIYHKKFICPNRKSTLFGFFKHSEFYIYHYLGEFSDLQPFDKRGNIIHE